MQAAEGHGLDKEDQFDEYEEVDDDEPILKYSRWASTGRGVAEILKTYAVSAIASHSKLIVLGSRLGVLHVLDFPGEEIRRLPIHSGEIYVLDIDLSGEYVASCSDDSTIAITSLFGDEKIIVRLPVPANTVAIDPKYAKSPKKQFVYGGHNGSLIVSEEGWFYRSERSLHDGSGAVLAAKWEGQNVAFADCDGVRVVNVESGQKSPLVERTGDIADPHAYPCSLRWESDKTLIIAWGNTIRILKLGSGPTTLSSAYLIFAMRTEYVAVGACELPRNRLLVLAFYEKASATVASEKPEIVVVDRNTRHPQVMESAEMSVVNYQQAGPLDYRLQPLSTEDSFYILSPKDIIIVKERDLDDRITWLKTSERFDEALQLALQERTQRLPDVADDYLAYLFDNDDVTLAVKRVPVLLNNDKQLWDKWALRFVEAGRIVEIASFIPLFPKLKAKVYTEALLSMIDLKQFDALLTYVVSWPNNLYKLYNTQLVVSAIAKAMEDLTGQGLSKPKTTLDNVLAKLKEYGDV